MSATLKNGTIWKTIDGQDIHAHGGYIIFHDGYYYWYGEDRRENWYVACYRSQNLIDWEFRNHVLTAESQTKRLRVHADLGLRRIDRDNEMRKINLERPKVLYNTHTNKFVLWAHYEDGTGYGQSRCAIASCDTPDGDFVYHGSFQPYGYMSRDCTLFRDDDGTAYFISSTRTNSDLNIYRLSEDYLNCDKLVNTIYQDEHREAPAVFKKDGMYYIVTSGCSRWDPNQGEVGFSTSMDGSFSIGKNFGDETTFRSQPAFILPVTDGGKTRYFYFGDHWGGDGDLYFTSSYVVLEIHFAQDGTPYIEYTDTFNG